MVVKVSVQMVLKYANDRNDKFHAITTQTLYLKTETNILFIDQCEINLKKLRISFKVHNCFRI